MPKKGRPVSVEGGEPRRFYVGADDDEFLKKLGNGNRSAGLREAIRHANLLEEAWFHGNGTDPSLREFYLENRVHPAIRED